LKDYQIYCYSKLEQSGSSPSVTRDNYLSNTVQMGAELLKKLENKALFQSSRRTHYLTSSYL